MTDYSWKKGKGGDWSDAADWSTDRVPMDSTAAATIDALGTYTVTIGSTESYSIASLALNNATATLSIDGSLTLHKRSSIDAGTLTSSNKGTLILDGYGNTLSGQVNGSLNIAIGRPTAFSFLTVGGTATITNRSTINQDDKVILVGSSTLVNTADGTYILEAGAGIRTSASDAPPQSTFQNDGSLIKVSAGPSYIDVPYTDIGTASITITAGTLDFDTSANFHGRIDGLGTLMLQGSTAKNPVVQTLYSSAHLNVSAVILSTKTSGLAADSLTVAGSISSSSVFTEQSSATLTIDHGVTLTLTGGSTASPSTFASTITGGGALALAGGSQSLNAGVKLTGTVLSMSGSDTLTINTNIIYSQAFTQTSGDLAIAKGDTLTLTGATTLAGAVTGLGTLSLSGTQTLNSGASLSVSHLTTSGSNKLTITAPITVAASVTLNGTTTLNGTGGITDTGTLTIAGILNSNGVSTASLMSDGIPFPRKGKRIISASIMVSGEINVKSSNLVASGSLKNVKKGKILVGASASSKSPNISAANAPTLSLDGGGSSTAGAFTVASNGVLDFDGSTASTIFTLTDGGSVGANTIGGGGRVMLTGGTLELGSSAITIACQFSQSAGSILDGTGTLTLTDGVTFADDSGTAVETDKTKSAKAVTLLESATLVSGNLALDGGRTLENAKTLTWTSGDIYLGINPYGQTLGGGTILNDAGATFNVEGSGVLAGVAGKTAFRNYGTMSKSGAGTATITATLDNEATGIVEVQHGGTLDLAGGVSGHGMIDIAGGTLQVDSILTPFQQVKFTADKSGLRLTDAPEFIGTISGFDSTDTIDLTNFVFGATKWSYAGNSKQGVLTVIDSGLVAKLKLFGDYVMAGFAFEKSHEANGGPGTVFTYEAAPPAHLALAPGH
jgi:hypothetical protein